MSRGAQQKRNKILRQKEAKETLKLKRKFLDAVMAFKTSKPKSSNAPNFSSIVLKALDAQLTRKHELIETFGISVAKAKKGGSTGVTKENRIRFFETLVPRAEESLKLESI